MCIGFCEGTAIIGGGENSHADGSKWKPVQVEAPSAPVPAKDPGTNSFAEADSSGEVDIATVAEVDSAVGAILDKNKVQ
jgi:hypothetical protein